jgi:hypothetical protein
LEDHEKNDILLELLLVKSERCWAYFMELKAKRDDLVAAAAAQDGDRIKHHANKRLKRGT